MTVGVEVVMIVATVVGDAVGSVMVIQPDKLLMCD